jgi:hypothetical protein
MKQNHFNQFFRHLCLLNIGVLADIRKDTVLISSAFLFCVLGKYERRQKCAKITNILLTNSFYYTRIPT